MLPPKFGIMSIVTDSVFDKKIVDATIVPVTINYEKVYEGNTYPYELLGEEKVKESLARTVSAAKQLNLSYGRIFININEPFTIK